MKIVIDQMNRIMRWIPSWSIYVTGLSYAAWLIWLGVSNQLGADPVEALEHALGEVGLYLLIAGLAVTPLRKVLGLNLMKFRRALGLTCFFFIVLHLLVWAILDVQELGRVVADLTKRPYIMVGMAAFLLMMPLAITSNNASVRRLGANWRSLHKLVYPAALLGGAHYLMLVKGIQLKPIFLMLVIATLIGLRFVPLLVARSSKV
ncbi:Sulfoxide reductase heme-binding subunit YedZ [Roseovarius albus]|uniref:Protein-methionine-sulfoxide reductase heme-binding subunit MsrQ n=1 Tax=Roseovarius albus TaxID=1247867 RepID=A0A1X7A7D3_9RHOB|nr:protein-methionine-sulfoxide reductase heme-binding subunit MsrQ [Roseovarius albus]SLN72365.1 Sulfoxide reductase heme-binding subunit YedZ [Roseovarius albus]